MSDVIQSLTQAETRAWFRRMVLALEALHLLDGDGSEDADPEQLLTDFSWRLGVDSLPALLRLLETGHVRVTDETPD